MGRVGRLCKWLTVLVDLPTGCSRSLLLHENNVYLLICFVESMATHSSHSSYKVGMTALLGENSEGFGSKLSSQTFRLTTMRYDADWWTVRLFESDECNFCHCIALWFRSDVSIQVKVICFIWLQLQMSFVVSRGASWIMLTVLFESQLSLVPFLSFSLWSKQESHFSRFSRGILADAFWLHGWSFSETSIVGMGHFSFYNVRKEQHLWSLFSFKFYAQCFLFAAVGAMNTSKELA